MGFSFFHVDAFSGRLFGGNPTGVCLLPNHASATWMQRVANEMALSALAFVTPRKDRSLLRCFSPINEVELCGQATLAAAHALWESGTVPGERPIRFDGLSGELTATRAEGRIRLDLPQQPSVRIATTDTVVHALGVPVAAIAEVRKAKDDVLVVLTAAAALRELVPHMDTLRRFRCRGVAVTAPSDQPEFDYLSRYFAPRGGQDEDPATGSSQCSLRPYWAEKLGTPSLAACQISERGGAFWLQINDGGRMCVEGEAITVLRGELCG